MKRDKRRKIALFLCLADDQYLLILGFDLSSYMPSLESFLNCEDLKAIGLTENATFQFLLRAGYEQILRTHGDMDFEV